MHLYDDRHEYDGYQTDGRLLEAIEEVAGGTLGQSEESEYSKDPAEVLWREGGRDAELITWLDAHYPDWHEDAPLCWGEGNLDVNGSH